jgi:hypothetical protein
VTAPKLDIQRIRVDGSGYDATGAYWGAGPDVFIAISPDGRDEIAVRARTIKEARQKIAAELERKPGAPQTDREPLGGNPPRKTRYEIAWRNPVMGETIKVRITHARDYLSSGTDHIEVESLAPKKAPLPITETGYRSHFMPALELVNAGGPVTFVSAWLEREAAGKAWRAKAAAAAQADLFQWADAQAEVGRRKKKPAAVTPRPRRTKVKPGPDPA